MEAAIAFSFGKKDLIIGKPYVLNVLAATPANPSFRAVLRTSRLWNQLCRKRAKNLVDTTCQECGRKPRRSHGAHHYETMLVSGLSLLKHKGEILKADWNGFGNATAKDFRVVCEALEHQLDPKPHKG